MARRKQRETYGNGSIVQECRNGEPLRDTWRVCVSLGTEEYLDKDGNKRKRQRKIQRIVHGSLKDARAVCKQLTEEYESIDFDRAQDTFSALYAPWIETMDRANICNKEQLKQYKLWLQYAAASLGEKPAAEIKQADIERMLAEIKAARGLSDRTMKRILQLCKRVFEYALDADIIRKNPCRNIVMPKLASTSTRNSLTAEEAARLRACLDRDEKDALRVFFDKEQRQSDWGKLFGRSALRGVAHISGLLAVRFMLATGTRRGECLALTWENISFEEAQVYIRQSLTPQMQVKEPKTAAGTRALYLDEDTLAHLKAWKAIQKRMLHLISCEGVGKVQDRKTPVFCTDEGGMINPANFERWWRSYRSGIGFESLRIHELRHTQATLLLGNGADIKTVQTRLGHASSSITLDQYAHAIPANDKAAADMLGAIMSTQIKPAATILDGAKSA